MDDGTSGSFLIKKLIHRSSTTPISSSLIEIESSPVLDGYKVRQRLGEGGMGAVYLVEDSYTKELFAAKVSTGSDDLREEYRITNLAYQRLSVVSSMGGGVIGPVRSLRDKRRGNRIVMLMPMYPLGDLETVFERRLPDIDRTWKGIRNVRKLIADTMVRLLAEVHLTLTRLHGERIVHRDIKPGNILVQGRAVRSKDTFAQLREKMNGWTALISDFGLALEISEAEAREENIKRSGMAGTCSFQAFKCSLPLKWMLESD